MPSGLESNGKARTAYPITYGFAGLVLLALGVLVVLRHLYGAIHIEGGTR